MLIYLFEAVALNVENVPLVIIRVPDDTLDDPFKRGAIMAQAQHEFKRQALLMGSDKGRIVGDIYYVHLLHHNNFDPEAASWGRWGMAEADLSVPAEH